MSKECKWIHVNKVCAKRSKPSQAQCSFVLLKQDLVQGVLTQSPATLSGGRVESMLKQTSDNGAPLANSQNLHNKNNSKIKSTLFEKFKQKYCGIQA